MAAVGSRASTQLGYVLIWAIEKPPFPAFPSTITSAGPSPCTTALKLFPGRGAWVPLLGLQATCKAPVDNIDSA